MMTVIEFVKEHGPAFMVLGVAVLDFIFAMSPKLKSNGILHSLYLMISPKDKA